MWENPSASSSCFIRLGGHKQILENIYISVILKKKIEVGNYDRLNYNQLKVFIVPL